MNTTDDFSLIKNIFKETLQSYNYNETTISNLLTDDFINGILLLQSQENNENELIYILKNFTDEQNLFSLAELEAELRKELSHDGYVNKVLRYIDSAWMNTEFIENNVVYMMTAIPVSDIDNTKIGISILASFFNFLSKRSGIGQKIIASEITLPLDVARKLHNQDKKYYEITDQFNDNLWAVATGFRNQVKTGEVARSPLVIDLDGDGIVETGSTDNGIYFDHDNNGFAENTGWVNSEDGLLVRDLNNNGQIDNGSELFGNNTVLYNGEKAANGFEALKDLDSNNDGVFNNQDTAWNEVKVWKDTNQNGIVDEGELLTLEQANISGINLTYDSVNFSDSNDNAHKQQGTFIKSDGTTGVVHDVWFDADLMNTVDKTEIEIPANIQALPNIRGLGNVHDLHTAMALDETGALKTLVEQYITETDSANKQTILYNIIYHWTGVQNMPIDGRDPTQVYGKVIDDTRKLEALEEFLGEEYLGTWCWGERDPNPHGQAAPYILMAFDMLVDYVNREFMRQIQYKSLLEKILLTWNNTTQTWDVDVTEAVSQIQNVYSENADNGIKMFREFEDIVKNINYTDLSSIFNAFRTQGSLTGNEIDVMLAKFGYTYGTDMNDKLTGTSDNDEISSLAGDDTIFGGNGDDILDGGSGNDNILGEEGDDILIGGAGNDFLCGGNGADTYLFNPGFGNDVIDNTQDETLPNRDVIQFGEGITVAQTTLGRQGFDLIVTVSYPTDSEGNTLSDDSVRVYGYFDKQGTSSSTVSSIVFADGTMWDYEYIRSHWNSIPGVDGGVTLEGDNNNNRLKGTDNNDILIGNDGDDIIYGYSGNDIIIGGKGDDIIETLWGDTHYYYNKGDGFDTILDYGNYDTIHFGSGISFSDLKFSYDDGNLKIIINNDPQQGILIKSFFYTKSSQYKIEDIRFFDGSVFHLSDVGLTLQQSDKDEFVNATEFNDVIYGNGGDDTINGGAGDDIIIGGKGMDILEGGAGNDVYVWNRGDGLDEHKYTAGAGRNDTIRFGAGISFSDLTFKVLNGRNGKEMNIIVDGDETQGIRYKVNYNDIAKLEFADGTIYDLTANGLTYQQTDDNEEIYGTSFADVIYAGGGDDIIHADGGDTIYTGKGSDTVYLESGENTIVYNRGDGLDTITNYGYAGGNSKVLFGEGISMSDLTFFMSPDNYGYDLHIILNGDKTQGIVIENFRTLRQYLDVLEFADGTVFKFSENGLVFNQTERREEINGTDFADVINAGNGDDKIITYKGNDIVNAGKGNDTIDTDSGEKTFIYNLGDGMDKIEMVYGASGNCKIVFGEGIAQEDLSFVRMNSDLYVYVKDRSQGMLLSGHFYYGERVKTLEFSNGSSVALANLGYTTEVYDNASIEGTAEDDVLVGNHLDNFIPAGSGNNTVTGGKGNDDLRCGSGNDVYIYNLGDGADTISDTGGTDKIVFGEGISQNDITFRRDNDDDLLIVIKGDVSQSIKVSSFFKKDIYEIETLEFSDGSSMNLSGTGLTFTLSEGENYMRGATAYDDIIYGGESKDTINAGDGNDIIIGGKGNDELWGDIGNDTYIWNLGDGFDTINDVYGENKIVFGEGISLSDLTFTRMWQDNLRILVNGDESQGLLIQSFFQKQEYRFKSLEFADGTSFNLGECGLTLHQTDNSEDIYGGNTNFDNIVYAGDGHDNISVGNGNNTLIGGRGNDTISGGTGNDTYVYNLGDGFDTISDRGGNNRIVFGSGISAGNLSFSNENSTLKIHIHDDESQGIKIYNQYANGKVVVETIEFHDGSTLDIGNADQLIQAMNSFSLSNSASTDTLSNPTQDVSDMYSLAANSDLLQKAV